MRKVTLAVLAAQCDAASVRAGLRQPNAIIPQGLARFQGPSRCRLPTARWGLSLGAAGPVAGGRRLPQSHDGTVVGATPRAGRLEMPQPALSANGTFSLAAAMLFGFRR